MQSLPQGSSPEPGSGLNSVPVGHNNRPPERNITKLYQNPKPNNGSLSRFAGRAATMAIAAIVGLSGAAPAYAQDAKIAAGDAVVSGFSGIVPSGDPVPPGGTPLDTFFIDLDGPSAQVLSFGALGGVPSGQLVTSAPKLVLKARDIGQVFGIALDDGLGASVPNIYLGATSAYGIHIARPNPAEPGKFLRLRKGHAEAQWMKGMFGEVLGGEPGSIFKVDGQTGSINLFATVPNNSGPGVGNVVFDKASKSIYASDLDSGLIQRIDSSGNVVASFDHGIAGRPAKGLAPVPDDGKVMVISDPAFDTEDPSTWGYTQVERQVYGMAIKGGRLYYAVTGGQQIWSVGLRDDGSFGGDPRWELDAAGLPGAGPITDMLFDKSGRMYLAQRGTVKGSYNYSEFAEPGKSTVVRYQLEQPDDPATESRWVPVPEFYAIGKQDPHQNANGGIALGFAHDEIGGIKSGTANSMLWSTGEKLRTSLESEADPAAENDVHGLQGNNISLVRPDNVPPQQSYFLDYDGLFNDTEKAGHMGDVEIWQPAGDFARAPQIEFPPDYIPPFVDPPGELPPLPPNPGYDLNLKLTKFADPKECFHWGAYWRCHYRITVRNTSLEHSFFGPIRVHDELINLPAGSQIKVPQHPFPWTCFWVAAPNKFGCRRDAFLAPGASVGFNVWVKAPKAAKRCRLTNIAEIRHPLGGSWNNTNPLDDIDSATAIIPDPDCKPNLEKTNLKIEKWADPQMCWPIGGNEHYCSFKAVVWNAGAGVFQHKLQVQDNPAVGTTALFGGDWSCLPNGPGHLCTHLDDPLTLFPFEARLLQIGTIVSDDVARFHNCKIPNIIKIVTPHGAGHPENMVAIDDESSAFANIPAEVCEVVPLAEAIECPPGFIDDGAGACMAKGKKPDRPLPLVPPVTTVDCPNDMRKVRGSQVVALRRNGWSLIRLKGGQWCGRPGKKEPPRQVCPQDMREIATRTVRRRRAAGWSVVRLSQGQWCGRPPQTVECPKGMRELSPRRAALLRRRGWSVTKLSSGQWCGKPGDPIVQPCPSGMTKVPLNQVKRLTSIGWRLTQLKSGQWCGRRPTVDPRPECSKSERSVTNQRSAVRLRRAGYNVRQVGKRLWCVSGQPTPPQACPKGMSKVHANQIKRLSAAGWRLTQLKSGQWCGRRPTVDPRPTCNKGERSVTSQRVATRLRRAGYNVRKVGKNLWCSSGRPQPSPCPKGQVRKNGYCVPVSCPRGMVGTPPNCRKIVRPCPKGMVGKYPNCRRVVRPCPKGMVGKYPNCRRVVRPCPKGMVGKYPNCRRVVRPCPKGMVGKYPNCRRVVRPCPKGTVGKYPNCRPVVRPCPKGMVGKRPNCRRAGGPTRPAARGCPGNMQRAKNGQCVKRR